MTIEPSYFWTNVLLLGMGTFAIRGSIIAISSRVRISDRAKELFSFIPAAILPAFIVPAVVLHRGQVGLVFGKERMIALVLATAVCFLWRTTLGTIVVGLVTLFLMRDWLA